MIVFNDAIFVFIQNYIQVFIIQDIKQKNIKFIKSNLTMIKMIN